MTYHTIDLEITKPLPAIALQDEEAGVAVLFRREGVPVDFWMEALPAGSVLKPEYIAQQISKRVGKRLLRASIQQEIAAADSPGPVPSLTIAICTKDRPVLLARCLDSIAFVMADAGGRAVEVLVVDNAPSDEQTQTLVASLAGVRYVCEPRPGLNFARNRALHEAHGTLLAFLDDDVIVDGAWLNGLRMAWQENPDAGAFTGLVLPAELETQAQILFELRGGFRRGFDKIRYHGQQWPGNPLYPCGAGVFGAGANMVFRREVLLALGGFDEVLDTGAPLPGGGDLDIFYRVVRAGYPLVYEPRLLVFHHHRRDMDGLRRQYRSWGIGFMAFLAKSYHTDVEMRRRLVKMRRWWFKDQARQFWKSLRGHHVLSSKMVLSEFWGGVVGLCGEYGRSERRVAHIREHLPAMVPADPKLQPEIL